MFRSWGLEVVEGEHLYASHHQFAGSDDERKADMQKALDDDSIRAIVCSRGGYGTVRIIDKLDFTRFRANPKWIVGYSDVTVLHSHIHRHFKIETLHATMLDYLNLVQTGELQTEPHPLFGDIGVDGWAAVHVRHFEHHLRQFRL